MIFVAKHMLIASIVGVCLLTSTAATQDKPSYLSQAEYDLLIKNFAQTHEPPQDLTELLSLIRAKFKTGREQIHCKNGRVQSIGAPQIAVYDGLHAVLLKAQKIKSGWHVSAKLKGCKYAENAMFNVVKTAKDKLVVASYLPGSGHSWTSLVGDTLKSLAAFRVTKIEQHKDADCTKDTQKDIKLLDIRLKAKGTAGPRLLGVRTSGMWVEEYTVMACRLVIKVPVLYMADATGGAVINVSSDALEVIRKL